MQQQQQQRFFSPAATVATRKLADLFYFRFAGWSIIFFQADYGVTLCMLIRRTRVFSNIHQHEKGAVV